MAFLKLIGLYACPLIGLAFLGRYVPPPFFLAMCITAVLLTYALFWRSLSSKESIAGLRYRKSALYPSLHPHIGIQMPLSIVLVERETDRVHKLFALKPDSL